MKPTDSNLTDEALEASIQARVCVSYFGQVWPGVVLLKFLHGDGIDADSLTRRLNLYDSKSEEKIPSFPDLVARGSVYIASFCRINPATEVKRKKLTDSSHPLSTREVKSIGGHAPSLKWLELLFPELRNCDKALRFRRLRDFPITCDLLRRHHLDQGEGKNCQLRHLHDSNNPSPDLIVEILLRVHLHAAEFDYNPSCLNKPIEMVIENSAKKTLYVSLSDDGEDLALYEKPPGCLAEPHVSRTGFCVSQHVYEESGRVNHPLHRLDRPVGGLMAIRLLPLGRRTSDVRPRPVSLAKKVYKAISETELSAEQILEQLRRLSCRRLETGEYEIITYMPPGNMFDRASPIFSSSKQHPGWKSCLTLVKLERTNVRLRSNPQDWASSCLTREMFDEVAVACQQRDSKIASFEITLQSGRRHQIRSVMAFLGFPLFLDTEYEKLKGYDCDCAAEIERASIAHQANRAEWSNQLELLIHSNDVEALESAKCSMWDADHFLLDLMRFDRPANVIGLHAWYLELVVQDKFYNAHSKWGPWWFSFFDLNGGNKS